MLRHYNPAIIPVPFGISNNGNTCYMNSLLQALLSCSSFVDDLNTEKNPSRIATILKSAASINDLSNTNVISISGDIIRQLKYITPGRQECSYEAFTSLLDTLGDKFSNTFACRYRCVFICNNCNNNFGGGVDHVYSIDMAKIESMLEHTTVQDGIICPRCNSNKTSRKYVMKMASDIIVCVYADKKITDIKPMIEFPGDNMRYKLVALVHHYGNQYGGHYNCTVLRHGSIYNIDDSSVNRTQSFNTNNPNNYMAFYHYI